MVISEARALQLRVLGRQEEQGFGNSHGSRKARGPPSGPGPGGCEGEGGSCFGGLQGKQCSQG